jgi:hypothetical protein
VEIQDIVLKYWSVGVLGCWSVDGEKNQKAGNSEMMSKSLNAESSKIARIIGETETGRRNR